MNCEEARILSIAHILGDLDSNSEQCRQLESHLTFCSFCTEEYKSSKWAIKFIEQHKTIFAEELRTPEEKEVALQEEIERSWKRIETKLDEHEIQEKRSKFRKVLVRVSAVAACLFIGIFLWLAFSYYSKLETFLQDSSPRQVASVPEPSVKVELVKPSGNIKLDTNLAIVADNELKTLLINGKHRMTMNINTVLAVEPQIESGNIGCLVKLVSGRIYVHVEHDGNPFIVRTTHGQAVITGTTFDVKATDSGTILVVVEGSVSFESRKGIVAVSEDQIFEIIADSAPTRPQSCDAAIVTAWATANELKPALAKIQSISDGYDLTELGLAAISGPIELDNIDYEDWIEEKRAWFKREFPWIFQLQSALTKEGIEADYPELLISSGDIWQFVYPETSPQQIPFPHFDSLLKAASEHGFDEQWLTVNIPGTKAMIDMPVPESIYTGQKAFEHWSSCFEKMRKTQAPPDSNTLLCSLHAAMYLVNTRTLAWLSLRNSRTGLSAEDKAEILILLQNEVNTANELAGRLIRMFAGPVDQPCDDHHELLDGVIEIINSIADIEKEVLEYEARK